MSTRTELHIVELTDESDDLIGYGVCVIVTNRPGGMVFGMQPEVWSTRSQAHAHAATLDGVVA